MTDRFLEDIDYWVKNNQYIQFACLIHGGWERWAQVEVACRFASEGIQSKLEDYIYADGSKDDITLIPTANLPGVVMELKAWVYGDSYDTFKKKLHQDAVKVVTPLKVAYDAYQRLAVGIAPADRLISELRKLYPGENINENNYTKVLEHDIPSHGAESVMSTGVGAKLFTIIFARKT